MMYRPANSAGGIGMGIRPMGQAMNSAHPMGVQTRPAVMPNTQFPLNPGAGATAPTPPIVTGAPRAAASTNAPGSMPTPGVPPVMTDWRANMQDKLANMPNWQDWQSQMQAKLPDWLQGWMNGGGPGAMGAGMPNKEAIMAQIKSQLPPWMQGQGAAPVAGAPAPMPPQPAPAAPAAGFAAPKSPFNLAQLLNKQVAY